jgi:phosphatidate cytidylyltransferase
MLLYRVITAFFLIIFVLLGIFFLPINWFAIVASLVIFAAALEYSMMWEHNKIVTVLFLLSLLCIFLILELLSPIVALISGVIWWLIVPYFLVYYSKHEKNVLSGVVFKWFVGLFVFIPCLVGIIELRKIFGPAFLLYILVAVWAADIGAYFAGKYFGEHKLAEAISPNKTMEGVAGGLIFSLIISVIGGFILPLHGIQWLLIITLVIVSCLWSIIGDLFESMLKRDANIKDSGCLLPGHGGIYDRIDSITAAIPIFTLGLMFFLK